MVMAEFVPEMFPETVIVRPGLTVNVFVVADRLKFPVTELLPAAVKFKALLTILRLEEMFNAPERFKPEVAVQRAFDAFNPDTVRLPVPALAVKVVNPYHTPFLDMEISRLIAPLVALVFRVRFPPLADLRPKSPVIVIFPAAMVVSETSSIPDPKKIPAVEPVKITFPLCVIFPLSLINKAVAVRLPVPVVEEASELVPEVIFVL